MKKKPYIENYFKRKRRIIFLCVILAIFATILIFNYIGKDSEIITENKKPKKIINQEIKNRDVKEPQKKDEYIEEPIGPDETKTSDNNPKTVIKEEAVPPEKQKSAPVVSSKKDTMKKELTDFETRIKKISENDLKDAFSECYHFAKNCSPKDLSNIQENNQSLPLWIGFFSELYNEITKSRFVMGVNYLFTWDCRAKLKNITSIFEPVREKLSIAVDNARKAGLYPGDVRDILEKYRIDMNHMELLCEIMTHIREEKDFWGEEGS